MTASRAQKVLVSSRSHTDVINLMPQMRHIGYRSAIALSFPIVQITADMQYQYRYDTNLNPLQIHPVQKNVQKHKKA